MSHLISVIIPVYNRQEVLEECVRSVLAQSHREFEILLIDDGSADRSAEVCRRLAEEDGRVRFFAAGHGGVSAARNIGLGQARGEYIFFLDSDDVIHPLLLETLVTAMAEQGAHIGGTAVVSVSQQNWHRVREILRDPPAPGETTLHSREETVRALLCGGSPLSCIGGVMIRKDLVGDTAFRPDLHIGEDYVFLYENVIKGAAGVFLKQKWYYARSHGQNLSRDYAFSGFRTRFDRRKLVWESEERLGRRDYAAVQKADAVQCFFRCAERNKAYSEDGRRMRAVMKAHWGVLVPALGPRSRLRLFAAVFLPFAYPVVCRVYAKLRHRPDKT